MQQVYAKQKMLLVALGLAVFAALPYVRVGDYDFLILDDYSYIAMNSYVQQGLTLDGLRWAFSTFLSGNWHPLTWLSHMFDVSLFGMDAGWHHLINVFYHSLSTALLFIAFYGMTGTLWRSAFIAALFGVHPMHVETVAWVAERKDVLSGFFFMLVLLSYSRYARRQRWWRYLIVAVLFALGLMTKPMLVTVPFVLMLMDVWPLGRTALVKPADGSEGLPASWRRLFTEKVPLLGLTLVSSVITYVAQQEGGAVSSFEALPFTTRLANATVSLVAYLGKMVWPLSLGVYYPHPQNNLAWWQIAGSALVLLALSYMVLRQLRRHPFLAVGWFWYLIMLIPVIGFIQVGGQAMADRYTYLPFIGPFIMIVWCAGEAVPTTSIFHARALVVAAVGILVILCGLAFVQVSYWSDSITLFTHTLTVTSGNAVAHTSLGTALARQGRLEEAIAHFDAALQIKYGDVETHRNMGLALADLGRLDEAIAQFRETLKINPGDRLARSFLDYYQSKQKEDMNSNVASSAESGNLRK
jgi:hypothetical protein